MAKPRRHAAKRNWGWLGRKLSSEQHPDCPKPTKRRYATEARALADVNRISRQGAGTKTPYLCECGWVHLTTVKEKP